jgi:hypothetical protein
MDFKFSTQQWVEDTTSSSEMWTNFQTWIIKQDNITLKANKLLALLWQLFIILGKKWFQKSLNASLISRNL